MIDIIEKYLTEAVDRKVFPGCAVGIITEARKDILTIGHYTYDQGSQVVTDDSVYDVASITKSIPVSSLALKLCELGLLNLNDVMSKYIPEYENSYRDQITVHHLLTQTLDFTFRLSDYKHLKSDELYNLIMKTELGSKPGIKYSYANATSILLGKVIERCSGLDLQNASRKYFFDPLRMNLTTFTPEKMDTKKIVPTEYDDWREKLICGEVHDESAWALRPMIAGSAGLFSTIKDLMAFLEMLINGGKFNNQTIFKEETVASIYQNQLHFSDNKCTGLGWELNQSDSMGNYTDQIIFGKTGFTGCSIAVIPKKRTGYVLLSNHIFPHRGKNRSLINEVRRFIVGQIIK